MCCSSVPSELLALHLYSPSSTLLILLNVISAVFFPELFAVPFLIHCTSGTGLPDAVQLILTEDP